MSGRLEKLCDGALIVQYGAVFDDLDPFLYARLVLRSVCSENQPEVEEAIRVLTEHAGAEAAAALVRPDDYVVVKDSSHGEIWDRLADAGFQVGRWIETLNTDADDGASAQINNMIANNPAVQAAGVLGGFTEAQKDWPIVRIPPEAMAVLRLLL